MATAALKSRRIDRRLKPRIFCRFNTDSTRAVPLFATAPRLVMPWHGALVSEVTELVRCVVACLPGAQVSVKTTAGAVPHEYDYDRGERALLLLLLTAATACTTPPPTRLLRRLLASVLFLLIFQSPLWLLFATLEAETKKLLVLEVGDGLSRRLLGRRTRTSSLKPKALTLNPKP